MKDENVTPPPTRLIYFAVFSNPPIIKIHTVYSVRESTLSIQLNVVELVLVFEQINLHMVQVLWWHSFKFICSYNINSEAPVI